MHKQDEQHPLPSGLSLHQASNALKALEDYEAQLPLPGEPLPVQDVLLPSGSDAEAAHNWMPAMTEPMPLQVPGELAPMCSPGMH